jgi:hypothetical protein
VLIGNTWSGLTKQKKKMGGGAASRSVPDARARPVVGAVVGEGAGAVGEENVGFRMLRALGWTPGMALGMGSSSSTATSASFTTATTFAQPAFAFGSGNMDDMRVEGGELVEGQGFDGDDGDDDDHDHGGIGEGEGQGEQEEKTSLVAVTRDGRLLEPISVVVRERRRGLGAE